MTVPCSITMLIALSIYAPPKGTLVIIPASALEGYTAKEIEQGKRCCRSRGIVCRIAEDK